MQQFSGCIFRKTDQLGRFVMQQQNKNFFGGVAAVEGLEVIFFLGVVVGLIEIWDIGEALFEAYQVGLPL